MEMGRKNKKHRSLAHCIEKEGDPLGRLLNYGLKTKSQKDLSSASSYETITLITSLPPPVLRHSRDVRCSA